MKVKEAMHADAEWRAPDTSLAEIAALMRSNDIGAVPIGENDRLVGMVTDRDIALRAFADGKDPSAMTASDVMSKGVVYCTTAEEIGDAIHLMEQKQIRRLPVIDEDKRLVGMLSLGDVTHAVSQELGGELARSVSGHH
ncbi:MAG: CBS domain-containing protein [Pseudomonadota bacterium]